MRETVRIGIHDNANFTLLPKFDRLRLMPSAQTKPQAAEQFRELLRFTFAGGKFDERHSLAMDATGHTVH